MNSSLKLIAGDASDKKFYRDQLPDGQNPAICMQFPKWEGGYGGDPFSWLEIHSALSEMKIPVPKVYKIDEKECAIWMEDLGDSFLFSRLNCEILDICDPACTEVISLYKNALELLVQAQYAKNSPGNPANNKFFDFEKLFDEMQFFINHFLNGFLDLNISKETHEGLYQNLELLCKKLDMCERVFCHRDYHVRNLMIKNDTIYWIDFQDARMGPHTYDAVSLLRDSYVNITWRTRHDLLQYYFEQLNQKRLELKMPAMDENKLYSEALLMGLQRNLKALGSFGYLVTQKNKCSYLKYVFHTLDIITSREALDPAVPVSSRGSTAGSSVPVSSRGSTAGSSVPVSSRGSTAGSSVPVSSRGSTAGSSVPVSSRGSTAGSSMPVSSRGSTAGSSMPVSSRGSTAGSSMPVSSRGSTAGSSMPVSSRGSTAGSSMPVSSRGSTAGSSMPETFPHLFKLIFDLTSGNLKEKLTTKIKEYLKKESQK